MVVFGQKDSSLVSCSFGPKSTCVRARSTRTLYYVGMAYRSVRRKLSSDIALVPTFFPHSHQINFDENSNSVPVLYFTNRLCEKSVVCVRKIDPSINRSCLFSTWVRDVCRFSTHWLCTWYTFVMYVCTNCTMTVLKTVANFRFKFCKCRMWRWYGFNVADTTGHHMKPSWEKSSNGRFAIHYTVCSRKQ